MIQTDILMKQFNGSHALLLRVAIPACDRKVVKALVDIYKQLDRQVVSFQSKTDLRCVPGCGYCCESTQVETSVLSLLPLAYELWRRGQAEFWLKKAASSQGAACIFYDPERVFMRQGCCQVHSLRPLVCRLFGFSVKKNKYGQRIGVFCSVLKRQEPKKCFKAQQAIYQGLSAPAMMDYVLKTATLAPDLARDVPINTAIKRALERTGFYLHETLSKKPRTFFPLFVFGASGTRG